MDLVGAIRWRYQRYVDPYRVVHRNPIAMFRRWIANRHAAAEEHPIAYVYANATNTGDHASYQGVRHLVGRRGVELYCAPLVLPMTLKTLASPPRSGKRWHAVFVGGGGLFQEIFDPFWKGVLEIDVPIVIFGVGANQAGNYRNLTDPALLRAVARKATAVHVRDSFTQSLLAPHGSVPVTVGVCPSMNYIHDMARDLARSATHLLHVIHEPDLSGAGVDAKVIRQKVKQIAGILGLAYDETDHMTGMHPSLVRHYARAAVVVSSRLHGCIFSYALGKPFLAIECDRKVGAFLESHAPDAPCLLAERAQSELSADLLAHVAKSRPVEQRLVRMADNVAVMNSILRLLSKANAN
jgi:polysaccharide pyruvyl transferase WcaK-like protein